MDEHDKTMRAARRVEEITGFYVHAMIFTIGNLLFATINIAITPDVWWAQWPFLGWGFGLMLHAIAVYGSVPSFVTRWQLRKIRQLRESM